MTVGRRIWLVTAVAVGLTGCRAAGTGSLSLLPRRNLSPSSSFELDEFVAQHNRNAEGIESLEAKPSIQVGMGRMGMGLRVDGRMAMERPRNFKLELKDHNLPKADIGSNADEFWYWVVNDDKDQKWVYWCDYRDVESSNLPVTYQPDWIMDALGLKPVTPEETAKIQVRKGTEAGTSILVFAPVRDRGEPYVREMTISTSDHRIKKLRIYTESPKVLIAEATPSDYQTYAAAGSEHATEESRYLPQKLKLDWKRERLVLDVALGPVKVNQFDHSRAAAIFTEPDMPGYTRQNLAQMTRGSRPDRRTRTRQTMPPPDSGTGVELGRPSPMPDESPSVPNPGLGRRAPRPAPAPDSDDPPLPTLNELVGAPVPRPPNSGPAQSASSLLGIPGRDSAVE